MNCKLPLWLGVTVYKWDNGVLNTQRRIQCTTALPSKHSQCPYRMTLSTYLPQLAPRLGPVCHRWAASSAQVCVRLAGGSLSPSAGWSCASSPVPCCPTVESLLLAAGCDADAVVTTAGASVCSSLDPSARATLPGCCRCGGRDWLFALLPALPLAALEAGPICGGMSAQLKGMTPGGS